MTQKNPIKRILILDRIRPIAANFSWITLDRVIRMAAGLVVGTWVARYLGPKQYGELSYLITYVALFSALASCGLDSIVVKELSKANAKVGEILGNAFALRFIGGAISAALCVTCFLAFGQEGEAGSVSMLLILSLSLLFLSFDVLDFWFQSQLKMRFSVLGRNMGFLIGILCRIAGIAFGFSITWFAIAYTIEVAFGAAGLLTIYYLSGGRVLRWSASLAGCLALINQAKYLLVTSILVITQARIDQIMLANLIGPEELGLYVAALRVVEVFVFLPTMIQIVLVPILSRDEFSDSRKHDKKLLEVYRLMVLIFLPIGLLLVFLSPQVVELLYGAQYEKAAPLLALLSIRLLLANFGVAKSLFFLRENAFGISFVGALVGCLTNISLNLVFIPAWGVIGVVWASTISFFVTIFLMDLVFSKTRRNFLLMIMALFTPWRLKIT